MSYIVINIVTGKRVHSDHTYAGCERWIERQADANGCGRWAALNTTRWPRRGASRLARCRPTMAP